MFLITCPPARPWCVNRMRDHHILPEDKVAPVMVLDGMGDSINDKNDSQIVEEIKVIKDSSQLHDEGLDTKGAIKSEDTPAYVW